MAVEWGVTVVVGCYFSPNRGLAEYEAYLHGLAICIRSYASRPVFVLGDFNAHSREWGDTRDDARGETILEWAAGLDLRLLNRGSVSTCVRWQGESIVDLSWATPSAVHMVSGWRVAEEVVSLSDHRHIVFDVSLRRADRPRQDRKPPRRWSLKRLDREMVVAASHVADWLEERVSSDPEEQAAWFGNIMASVCDASMPRVRPARKGSAYWWSVEISQLRTTVARLRRPYLRARRRRRATAEEIEVARREYGAAVKALSDAIAEAKARSWKELIGGLDRDPWGRPYKIVLGKLKPWVPPLTETLDPEFLGRVVDTLFPRVQDSPLISPLQSDRQFWSDECEVTEGELDRVVRRLASRNTAPGPDGIPGRALVIALSVLGDKLRRIFTDCLSLGVFPLGWKEARLVLLKKEGRTADSPSAFRPICLLNESGKLFERIISDRISGHLSRVGPDLSDCQFGFRRGRSTVDAIRCVRSMSESAVRSGGVALAVSLYIVNAFGTLPWQAIRAALEFHEVPLYLRAVIGAYLRDRTVKFIGRGGVEIRRQMTL
ncbi:unnamed protein product [Arctia plantaginis]|uniref:Reverse transcriptase domain-containing protein n=1 Tax=Arctia plantaginis TaxID=874455 RepID=A0A8S1A752_ARCPL|nr:unnamed protein product [Arctia plantaginis]